MSAHIEKLSEQILEALDVKLTGSFGEMQELALIKALQEPPYQLFSPDSLQSELFMFQTHFMLYHALYKLREQWLKEQYAVIDIMLSRFVIYPYDNSPQDLPVVDNGLRAYYLDLNNIEISQEDVESLLNSFWKRFLAGESVSLEQLAEAYQHLELAENCSDIELRKRFKALSLTHHPDRGGNEEEFRLMQSAYELIKASRHKHS